MRLAVLTAVFALAAGPLAGARLARADEARAVEETLAGHQALEAKDYVGAQARYRTALEALPEYLPARHGLGEALHGAGKTAPALAAWRQVLSEAQARESVPAAWRKSVEEARARLAALDALGRELDALLDAQADLLVAFAERQKTADPDLADRALAQALALVPGHDGALALRGRMGTQGQRREALFDGRQIEDWDGGRSQWWKVADGVIVCDAEGVATFVRTQRRVEGDFDLVLEARWTVTYGKSPYLALLGAWNEEYDNSRFGVLADTLQWREYQGSKDDDETVFRAELLGLPKPFDPKAWTTYELRYRGRRIEALVNGRKVADLERPPSRAGGFVGLLAQDCRAEFRKLEVVYR